MTLPLSVWTTGLPVPRAERRRGRFIDMIRHALGGTWEGPIDDVDCVAGQELPAPDEVAGVIVTGSPARISTRASWMLEVEQSLRSFSRSRTPVLGICFGHQLLGRALGGECGPNPLGREIGTCSLRHLARDKLVAADPAGNDSTVVMTHLDSVLELPAGAERLAETALEPNAAVRFGESVWGVQFHPEMDAEIIGDYLEERRDDIEREGLDVDALLEKRVEAPYGPRLLRRFAVYCAAR